MKTRDRETSYKPRREGSERTKLASTLTLDFHLQSRGKYMCLPIKPYSLQYLVRAAQAGESQADRI